MFEKYKYYLAGILVALLIIFYIISDDKEEENEMSIVQPITKIEEKNEDPSQNITVETSKPLSKKVIDKPMEVEKNEDIIHNTVEADETKEEITKSDKAIELTTSKVQEGNSKYSVQIIADKSITSERTFVRYIILDGIIEKDNNSYPFGLSLDSTFSTEWDINLQVKILSSQKNENYTCDGSFLKGLNPDSKYEIKIDIYDDSVNCYITNEAKSNLFSVDPNEFKFENLPKEIQQKILEANGDVNKAE